MPVMLWIRSADMNPRGVMSPLRHHFLNARIASSRLTVNGMTSCGRRSPDTRSARTTPAPQKLHFVAAVSGVASRSAPQLLQWYTTVSATPAVPALPAACPPRSCSISRTSILLRQDGQDSMPASASYDMSLPQLGHL